MLSQEQLKLRKTGIGASEIGAVLGLSKWSTSHEVWHDKVTEAIIQKTSNAMEAGSWLEDGVAKWAADRFGWKLHLSNKTLRHKKHPWMLASIDRFIVEERRKVANCEVKTTLMDSEDWGPDGTDLVPDMYRCQVQQQMTVTGLKVSYLPCLFLMTRELRVFRIEHNDYLEEVILEGGERFWRENVEARTPPEIDGSKGCSRALEYHFRKPSEEIVQAPGEAADYGEAFLVARAEEKAAKARKDEAGNYLKYHIGAHKGVEDYWGRALWSVTKGKVSQAAVIAELTASMHPEEREALKERHRGEPSRTLNVTAAKKGDR